MPYNKKMSEFRNNNKTCNYCNDNRREWRKNNPEKVKEARERLSEKRYYCPVCEYDVQWIKKSQHENSQWHKDNVRKQTHPEEFENEDKPDDIFTDKQGRTFYSCKACMRQQIWPYQWRLHISREAHQHNKEGKSPFRFCF